MLSEREKLEEELRFLKESLEIGVITNAEFEKGKERIDKRIEQIERIERRNKGLDIEVKEADEEVPDVKTRDEKEAQLTLEGKKAEERKEFEELEDLDEFEEEKELLEPREKLELKKDNKQEKLAIKEEETDYTETEEKEEDLLARPKEQREKKEDKEKDIAEEAEIKINKKLVAFSLVIMVAALGIWYLFYSDGNAAGDNVNVAALIACHSDKDCKAEGKVGMCSDPGQESSECSYIDDARIKLTILNSGECFNCDTARILSVIKGFYPNLEIENLDFDAEEGKKFADKFNLNALPAYILNSSVLESHNYEKFSNAFSNVDNNFVMKNTVANSNYYVNRNEISLKLDLFMQENHEASIQAERNLQEFLQAFNGKVDFEKHNSDSLIAKELGINSFPAFLVNNKNKFSGVQAADTIKENFCKMNDLEECSTVLSKSLI